MKRIKGKILAVILAAVTILTSVAPHYALAAEPDTNGLSADAAEITAQAEGGETAQAAEEEMAEEEEPTESALSILERDSEPSKSAEQEEGSTSESAEQEEDSTTGPIELEAERRTAFCKLHPG